MKAFVWFPILGLLTFLMACASAPARPADPAAPPATAPATGTSGSGSDSRAYREMTRAPAVTDSGLFVTHRTDEKLYYEIPRELLGADMLLVTTIARNTDGQVGGAPLHNRLIRWERHGDRIMLRSPGDSEFTADPSLPIHRAVAAATHAPILATFPIAAWSPDSAAVIEVTRLFTGGVPEFGSNHEGTLERDRTFIERVAAYPGNIEVQATHTRTVRIERPGVPRAYSPPPQSQSIVLHWSMLRLPEDPMLPRLFDPRVGFFSVGKTDFGTAAHYADRYRYINRWRLECRAGERAPCEPVRPITYYVDPATPERWIPWIKQGVEAWQSAFERAGFRNAIVARDAPTPEEDAHWAPEDARYSVVRWMASTHENAIGPHVHDPRTGEILVADIMMYHNILKLLRDWYFVQAAPLDARAQRLPLPDSLMGELLAYMVSHEVGHTLGLQHNFRASAAYPVDSLRHEGFLRRMGHVPSIMDYSRFNYLVQPEDRIPPGLLIPRVGPYDEFAIMWGYRPVDGAITPADELRDLDEWARLQDSVPWYRFNVSGAERADAGQLTEAVGNADPVRATQLGLNNIRRTVPLLIPATVRPGESFDELAEMYGLLVSQWRTELEHVVALVGGVDAREKHGGQEGWRFTAIPAGRQRAAVAFLVEEAFPTPHFLLDPEILRRIEIHGALERIGSAQRRILSALLDDWRLERMIETQALAPRGETVYTVGEMLGDVRRGVWSELRNSTVRTDAFRRNLQDGYLDLLDQKLNAAPPQGTPGQANRRQLSHQARALLRGELHALDDAIDRAVPRATDRDTRLHLEHVRTRISRILDPRG